MIMRPVWAALALLGTSLGCSGDAVSPRPTQLVTIEGLLVTSSGQRVAGAAIASAAYEGVECGIGHVVSMASARTGEDGSFRLNLELLVGIPQCIAVIRKREYPTETTGVTGGPPIGGGPLEPDSVVVEVPIPTDGGVVVVGTDPTQLICTPPAPCPTKGPVISIPRPIP